jgi:hypothetical protein
MLIPATIAVVWAVFEQAYLPIEIVTVLFLYDFIVREVFGMTVLSPFALLGTLLVRNQRPEWVGATQKRFAWGIGVVLAITVTTLVHSGIRGWPLGLCALCIVFMWAEAALGICVGCKIHAFLIDRGWIKRPEYAPACPGGVCALPSADGPPGAKLGGD